MEDGAVAEALVRFLESYGLPGFGLLFVGWLYLQQLKRNDAQQVTIVRMAEKMGEALAASTGAINSMREAVERETDERRRSAARRRRKDVGQ